METQIRTPQAVFMQPQRLMVPLFQRPYVWNREMQWEPLWNDVTRLADRFLAKPEQRQRSHFLGAVVLQQVQRSTGQMQERMIIDGQQRLTTLQILLDALHAELMGCGAKNQAMRIESLVVNAPHFCQKSEDRFKVWPTNRDRPAFQAVMAAPPPVDYDAIGFSGERMVEAHRFFSEQARDWLGAGGPEQVMPRADAIDRVVRDSLQVVVIDLSADENAQEIFETLNARGTQLTAADLIKNLIFQRLLEANEEVEGAYQRYWKEFETGFWEAEIGVGRNYHPRSSLVLNHWLIAQTGEEVVAREVFTRFKTYVTDAKESMLELLGRINRSAGVYRQFVEGAQRLSGPIDRLGLFAYRTSVLDSEVIKPLMLVLLDPDRAAIPPLQLDKALQALESWMVRRMLVRQSAKAYNQLIAELIQRMNSGDRSHIGDEIETFLAEQKGESRYWPDDREIKASLSNMQAYRRLRRGRLRMVLEAIEDHQRGWTATSTGFGGERVMRGKLTVEHILPRSWSAHWPLEEGGCDEGGRNALVHTIGNLTLLTTRLNSRVSNGSWIGPEGKRSGLERFDVFMMNRAILAKATEAWTESMIHDRTQALIQDILQIWPVPTGHQSNFLEEPKKQQDRKVDLTDLISAGLLQPGMRLVPRRKRDAHHQVTLLADGSLDVDGTRFTSPSGAASFTTGSSVNGWWYFLVSESPKRTLRDVLRGYISSLSIEADDVDEDDNEDEEEES